MVVVYCAHSSNSCVDLPTGRRMMTSRTKWMSAGLSYRAIWWLFVGTALFVGGAAIALAGPREQAQRIHDRIAGVPASEADLLAMENLIAANDYVGAALYATHNRHFYTVTLKNFAAPWTNRDQSAFVPLNDYTALVIGMVKDDVPFD